MTGTPRKGGALKIHIIAVGRAKGGPETALFDEYAGRIPWSLTLVEREARKSGSPKERQREEGERLLAAVPDGALVVALDEAGKSLTSAAFAQQIADWQMQGVKDVVFLIGGADGHGPAVTDRANLILSFGPMTWPHLLVRPMLAEQLYRAWAILNKHPYHRG